MSDQFHQLELFQLYPGKLTAGTQKWSFGSDDILFQTGNFQVPAVNFPACTLPETNIAPENRPSQKETSVPTIIFQVLR